MKLKLRSNSADKPSSNEYRKAKHSVIGEGIGSNNDENTVPSRD